MTQRTNDTTSTVVPRDRAGSPLPWIVAGTAVALAVAVAAMEWVMASVDNPDPLWDLAVYRGAIQLWLDGGSLYDFLLDHPARPSGFPFTYPPFAALVLLPLAVLPTVVADNLWTLVHFGLVAVMATFVVWRAPRTPSTWLGTNPSRARLVTWSAGAAIALMLTFPGLHNVVLGQVSFLVTALVLVDVGGLVPSRWRGVLVGVAAALKLTPLIVVPYFLVTRQWRAAAMSVGSFLVATVLAAVVIPQGSWAYWTRELLDTSRVGEAATVQNKSILGLLARWEVLPAGQTVVWLIVAGIVGLAALWQARRQYLAGELVGAALIVGCASVAVSPISWPHHQSWIVLVAVWLLLRRRWVLILAGIAILLVYLAGSPFMGQEVLPQLDTDPLPLRLGRELPTVAFIAVCLLGLPLADRPARRGSMAPSGSPVRGPTAA